MNCGKVETEIVEWLKRRAISIDDDARNDLADLRSLHESLRHVRIVGFGDVTHGTKEFFEIRNRLLHFLVTEMGFRALAIEASYSAAQSINDYVLHGKGDPAVLVSKLKAVTWDVQEFMQVLEWLRAYNDSCCDHDKVSIIGLDIWNTEAGREKVLAYIRSAAPQKLPSCIELFDAVARSESNGILTAREALDEQAHVRLDALLRFLVDSKDQLVKQTSQPAFDEVYRHLKIISQWIRANISDLIKDETPPDIPRTSHFNNILRSRYMAENLIDLMQAMGSDAKLILWAHIFHVGVGAIDPEHGAVPNMGAFLRDRWGDRYYVFGLECNRGAYLARVVLANNTLGDLKIVGIPAAPTGSLSWYLSALAVRKLALDLRGKTAPSAVAEWLAKPRLFHSTGWCYSEPPHLYSELAIGGYCDGMIFVEDTSPTTATPNALKSVADRAAH